jgi:gluconokinase
MGVAGAGKTTVGRALAAEIGCRFVDADDYHSPASRKKMEAGIALTDEDRWLWLRILNALLRDVESRGEPLVLACSALKADYRTLLTDKVSTVVFVYLRTTLEVVRRRLQERIHFFNPALLASQFETLEEPRDAVIVDASATIEEITKQIRGAVERRDRSKPSENGTTAQPDGR